MKKSSLTLAALMLASLFLYACSNETNNPVLSQVDDLDMSLAAPSLWAPNVDDPEAMGLFMAGALEDLELTETTVEGDITAALPGGNFILQPVDADALLVMVRGAHMSAQRVGQPEARGMMGGGRGMMAFRGRPAFAGAGNAGDATSSLAGIEVGASVSVTGYLVEGMRVDEANWSHEEIEMPAGRLIATSVLDANGGVLYELPEDATVGPLMQHLLDGAVPEQTDVGGTVVAVLPSGNFLLETADGTVLVNQHRGPVRAGHGIASRGGMMGRSRGRGNLRAIRNVRTFQPRISAADTNAVEVAEGEQILVSGYLMPHMMEIAEWPHSELAMPESVLIAISVTVQ